MATACIVPAMHVAAGTGREVAGRYYLQDPIGRGAMGTVWRARDALLARDVAVKEVLLRGASTPEDRRIRYERTLREARTAARLNHPAVVTVYDVVEADGSPWIVMELVQASSLEQILAKDGPLPPHKAADVGTRLLGALATAHAAGILHRDVKPSNVLLGRDDRAVLTDFGIATLEGDPGLTQAGMVMGTPGFTAPERIRGQPATPASDLWSLGATLYAAVEGHGPFDECGSSLAVLSMIANEDAPRSRSAGALGPAIDALLRRNPSARPDVSTAARLLAAAVAPPADNQPLGGGYGGEGFRGDRFWRDRFRGGPYGRDEHGRDEHGRDEHGQDEHGQDEHRQDEHGRDTYRREGPPPVRPADGSAEGWTPPVSSTVLPVSSTVLPEGSTRGSRPAAPQPPPADLPAWMSFPPEASPPEGIRPPAASAMPAPMHLLADTARPTQANLAVARDPSPQARQQARPSKGAGLFQRANLPWGANLARGANLGRAIGIPARTDTPAGTGPSGPWAALSGQAGHPPGRHGAQALGHRPKVERQRPQADGRRPQADGRRPRTEGHQPQVPGHRRWLLAGLGAFAVACAGVAGGLAIGHSGRSPLSTGLSTGYHRYTVPAAETGTAAGFTMAIPNGWHARTHGLITDVVDPVGHMSMQVDLAPFEAATAPGEASLLDERGVTDKGFPGYHRVALRSFLLRGSLGAELEFTWQAPGLGRTDVVDVLLKERTPAGRQAYKLQMSVPTTDRAAGRAIFAEALRTFRPR